jgi:hypothetical protein
VHLEARGSERDDAPVPPRHPVRAEERRFQRPTPLAG